MLLFLGRNYPYGSLFTSHYFKGTALEWNKWANLMCVLNIFLIVFICLSGKKDIFWGRIVTHIMADRVQLEKSIKIT